MEFQSSRLRARTGPDGRARPAARPGPPHAGTASTSTGARPPWPGPRSSAEPRGPYTLQAAIAACHARAFRPEETDWDELVALYGELARTAPSPIVELNRAVAVSMASGPRGRARTWSTSWSRRARSSATTSSTACAATCSTGSAATPRRPPSSTGPRHWPPTRRSGRCSWIGPRLSGPGLPGRGLRRGRPDDSFWLLSRPPPGGARCNQVRKYVIS